ncbi:MFS transporter [Streptomyces sp. WAC01280]|uniref:MFS transporter n=1 Tax=Streptomyces sp. WAC01280 TaxID=2487424 RepID=UPI00163D1185|nr:MFS transporter [Streptomyces sp. WAC01280]
MPSSPPGPAIAQDSVPPRRAPARPGLLGPVLCAAYVSWMLPFHAASTLVQSLLGELDDDTKLQRYAVMATTGALTAMCANIAFGLLSDRTRSRFGRRNPWILTGGFGTTLAIFGLSFTQSFPVLLTLWILLQISLNAVVAPMVAILPDRVASADLGKASSWIGVGQLLGSSLGAVAAGVLLTVPAQGLRWIAGLVALGGLLVFFAAPDRPSTAMPVEPFAARTLARTLLPPRDADFLWALIGRLLTLLGLSLVMVYQLYVLTDHLGLSSARAGSVIGVAGAVTALTAGVAIAVCGPLSDRVGRRKVFVLISAGTAAVSVLPLAFSPSLGAFFTFAVVGALGYGCFVAVDQVVMTEVLPDQENRAKNLGILNIANTLPQVLAPVVAMAVVPAFGYRGLFLLAATTAAVGGLCIVPIRRVP